MTEAVKFSRQRKKPPEITQSRAQELFYYDPETGVLTRRKTAGNSGKGAMVLTKSSAGYLRVLVDWHRYYVHQVIWVYVHGEWPNGQIDHIDNDRTNNRIKNLRVCNASANCLNQRKPRTNNKLGLHGVHELPSGKYRAQCQVQGKKINLGLFEDKHSAAAAYQEFKKGLP